MESLQETIDAAVSPKHALQGNLNQYETPIEWARFFRSLLPRSTSVTFDPQRGSGNLIGSDGTRNLYGFEMDNRFRDDGSDEFTTVIGNCVKAWEVLDEFFPTIKFPCQCANPPFGIRWKLADGSTVDSTEYTWKKILERASGVGYGFFIANHKTIERLGIDKHEWVYLYQKFPAGIWKDCGVEIGVVHWHADKDHRPAPISLTYQTLDRCENSNALGRIKSFYSNYYRGDGASRSYVAAAFQTIQKILDEDKGESKFNVWLGKDGSLKTYLSTRDTKRKDITQGEILQIARVNGCHPLTLTTERDTRMVLKKFVESGLYTIEPSAKAAIEAALEEVKSLACPLMPITDFETVAYADEEDHLKCFASSDLSFTPGKSYAFKTESYSFMESFKRNKIHFNEETGETFTIQHHCTLSGNDRMVVIYDDRGRRLKFKDKLDIWDYPESKLWEIFEKPNVLTVKEAFKELVAKNRQTLKATEMLAEFTHFDGQIDYLSRVATKDYGLIAASVGTGKSLMAISLINLKAPRRALIIAPQGTMRGSDDDDDDCVNNQASQWSQELARFAPGFSVFELFSMDDYRKIKKANGGLLPLGVYVSYPQAMFQNGGRETLPKAWTDAKVEKDFGCKFPPVPEGVDADGVEKYWCNTIGEEKRGIRCVLQPCMSTLIGHEFDMVCLDEAQFFTNIYANCTQMLMRMQPKYRFAFTATPIPNTVSNMFSLMGWLTVPDWYKGGLRSAAWPFARHELDRFVETFQATERDLTQERMNRNANPDWKGKCEKVSPVISSPARLLKILKPTMAYISKEACNPALVACKTLDVRVPMGFEQSKLYGYFLDRGNIPHKNPLIRARLQISYLRSICASPATFSHGGPSVTSNMNPKTLAILEIVKGIVSAGQQVVVVCARVGQSDTIQNYLLDVGVKVARIDSTLDADQHSGQSNLFKRGGAQVMLMGIKCAVGHSYHECPNMVIGSLEYSYGSKHQAEGRVWRVNSKQPVTIYCVLHKSSIEETMFDVCATKQDAATICLLGKRVPKDFKPLDMSEVLSNSIAAFDGNEVGVSEATCKVRWNVIKHGFGNP